MGRFTLLENSTYTDPAFVPLSTEARLLFIWSFTNLNAAICGLYRCSEREMRRALGRSGERRISSALEELAAKPLVRYDADNEVIWVVNRARHANRSPKVARAMQKEIEACPPSPLVPEFVAMYGSMLNVRLENP